MANELTPERLAHIRAWLMAEDDDLAEADGDDALTFAEGCTRDLLAALDAARAENQLLRGAMAADDARLLAASERVGAVPMGSDTADHMADVILQLKDDLRRERGLLGNARAALEARYKAGYNAAVEAAADVADAYDKPGVIGEHIRELRKP